MTKSSLYRYLVLFSFVFGMLHTGLLFLLEKPLTAIVVTHLFFFIITGLIISSFLKAVEVMIEKAGFVFIGLEFLKALALLGFLWILKHRGLLDNFILGNMMAIYLMHLFFSMFTGLRVLNQANKNISSK